MKPNPSLPLDGPRILELAAPSTFELFAHASEDMLLVDHAAADPLSFRTPAAVAAIKTK
jgi:hypothetical protein